MTEPKTIVLGGHLSLSDAVRLGNPGDAGVLGLADPYNTDWSAFRAAAFASAAPPARIEIEPAAWERVRRAREAVDLLKGSGQTVYGINTGFGSLASKAIDATQTRQLQVNLIRSHAAGSGHPISAGLSRRMLALRINSLAQGHSGVREATLRAMIDIYNAGCVPYVPEQGTVGASGDLAPLSHMALALMGEGGMWDAASGRWAPSSEVLRRKGLAPVELAEKEGLAMNNGTPFMLSHLCAAVRGARVVLEAAVRVACLSLEGLAGTHVFLDSRIHTARPHSGQVDIAGSMRATLGCGEHPGPGAICAQVFPQKVQDGYSLRCTPQILGPALEELETVERTVVTELNATTDNPLVFVAGEHAEFLGGGNFHGQPLSFAADKLAIAVQHVATLSERRLFRLTTADLSKIHPSYLVESTGLNSGFMIVQYLAAALTSENKILCHPASVDTIPTSEGCEDHVSMGGFAVRKACAVIDNVTVIVAAELLAACQALDFLLAKRPEPALSPSVKAAYDCVRAAVPHLAEDRCMANDVNVCTRMVGTGFSAA